MKNTFIFTGLPGAGKGTQAKLLAERLNARFISAGAELREFAELDTPVSRKVKEEIDQGLLLPHWVPIYLFHTIVFSLEGNEPIVLDGFARKPLEARTITKTFNWIGRPFTVINLNIPEDIVQDRVDSRKEVHERADDEVVDKRVEEFKEHTADAIQYFREHAEMLDIDGTQSIETIQEEIWSKIQ